MVQSGDPLANITKYVEDVLLGEPSVQPVIHHLEDGCFVVGHQEEDFVDAVSQEAHARVDVPYQVRVPVQIGLENNIHQKILFKFKGGATTLTTMAISLLQTARSLSLLTNSLLRAQRLSPLLL